MNELKFVSTTHYSIHKRADTHCVQDDRVLRSHWSDHVFDILIDLLFSILVFVLSNDS